MVYSSGIWDNYTYFFHFFFYNFNHLIMCDKDEAFSPCDGHCLCVSHGIQCQCQSCDPKQGSQNHCFLLMWELFPVKSKTSKKIHKSNFNAFLLTSFIDYNISRKCMLNRFTYSVWKSLMYPDFLFETSTNCVNSII